MLTRLYTNTYVIYEYVLYMNVSYINIVTNNIRYTYLCFLENLKTCT